MTKIGLPAGSDVRVGGKNVWPAYVGMIAAMAMFAGNFVLGRRAVLTGIDAFDLVALRYAVAGLMFLPVLLTRAKPIRTLGLLGWKRAGALTLLGGAPYFLAVVGALSFAPAGHGVVLNPGTTTLAALVMAAGQGDRLGRWAMGGVLLMLAGLVLVAGDGLAGLPDAPLASIGDLLLICSGVAWAAYGVLLRRWGLDGLTATAVVSVLSLAWLPPYILLASPHLLKAPVGEVILQGFYQGLLAGGLAVLLYSRAIVVLGVARAALFPPLVPVLGTGLAFIVLGETVSGWQIAGMVTTVVGMITCAFAARRPKKEQGAVLYGA